VRQAGFVVLYKTTMPSVLIELGFLSNASEEKYLKSEAGQDYMASAIFRAIRDYSQEMDKMYSEHKKQLEAEEKKRKEEEAKKKPVYRIQVYASKKKATSGSKVYRDFKTVKIEKASNGVYRHVVNKYTDLEKAKKELKSISKRGYKGAYIVEYKNDERVRVIK